MDSRKLLAFVAISGFAVAPSLTSHAALAQSAVQATPNSPAARDRTEPDEAYAEPLAIDRGSVGLSQTLRRLHTRASMLQINAHPDDEDGGMLTYESRGQGAQVSLLSLNRGEGGQNVMTGDYWDSLGILRTQEHIAANRYYGAHVYYTRVADFGFSKTLEEALKQWSTGGDPDRLLRDAVRVVRETRPLVVTSVFTGYVSDGHGHHQAAGMMAQEVYRAAGDPKMFPEQIAEGLRPWTPLKVYARVPFARVTDKGIFDYATNHWEPVRFQNYALEQPIKGVPQPTVTIPEGTYNPLFGESYLQVARTGLNQQKTQFGGIALPGPGRFETSYHLYASRVQSTLPTHEDSFFDGIDTSLEGIATNLPHSQQQHWRDAFRAISADVEEASARFKAEDPSLCAPALAEGLKKTRAAIAELQASSMPQEAKYNATFELLNKEQQFERALNQALGVDLRAQVESGSTRATPVGPVHDAASSQSATPGEDLNVSVAFADQGRATVEDVSLALEAETPGSWKLYPKQEGTVGAASVAQVNLSVQVPQDAAVTRPYFSRPSIEQSFYNISQPAYLSLPTVPYPLIAVAHYTFHGATVEAREVVQAVHRVPGAGPVSDPLMLVPAISIHLSPEADVVPLMAKSVTISALVQGSTSGATRGTVSLSLPDGWTATPKSSEFSLDAGHEDESVSFQVTPGTLSQKVYRISAKAVANGRTYDDGYTMIGYPGERAYPRYTPAQAKISGVDVKVPANLRVGFVMGTGEDVPETLRQMGVNTTMLSDADLLHGDLSEYDCIVLGIRTFAARPVLPQVNARLLQYVHDGGVLLTEYQTAEFDHGYAPYPLSVPGDAEKVVEEDAKVTITRPDDPAMTWPNRIGPADFSAWVEERGHGFPRSIDPHFTALTEVHDTGQDPQTGGLVYARYGRGYYVYLAYAFFRQMPEGVPGSVRIMANLLSLGRNPGLKQ